MGILDNVTAEKPWALEAIDFQKKANYKQIEVLIAQAMGIYRNRDVKKGDINKELSKSFKTALIDLFGLEFGDIDLEGEITKHGNSPAFIIMKPTSLTNPMVHVRGKEPLASMHEDYLESTRKEIRSKKGTIDTKRAKVGGAFKKIFRSLHVNIPWFMSYNLTPAEIAAVMFHECGHGFDMMYYSDRLRETNLLLLDMLESKQRGDSQTLIYDVVGRARKDIIDKEDLRKITKGGDRLIMPFNVANSLFGKLKSDLGNSFSDTTENEHMADNFATKLGYGAELFNALDKIHLDRNGDKSDYSPFSPSSLRIKLTSEIMQTAGIYVAYTKTHLLSESKVNDKKKPGSIAIRIAMILFLVVMFVILLPFIIMVMAIVLLRDESNDIVTYDSVRERMTRIKRVMISQLRDDKQLSNQEARQLVTIVESLHEVINNYDDDINNYANLVLFQSKSRKAYVKDIDVRTQIEELAASEIFVKANKFKYSGA